MSTPKDNGHRDLFKATSLSKNGQQWKDKLKENCLQKAKQQKSMILQSMRKKIQDSTFEKNSSSIVTQFQSDIPDIISQEWKRMKYSGVENIPPNVNNATSNMFGIEQNSGQRISQSSSSNDNTRTDTSDLDNLTNEDYTDIMRYLEQELIEDLRKEELRLISQYEEMKNFEEQAMQAAIDGYYSNINLSNVADSNTVQVLCPMCKQNRLLSNKGVIFCSCGLRLDTQNDNINLGYLQKRLFEVCQNHSAQCPHEPMFGIRNSFGISALSLSCEHCDALEIVL